MNDPKRRSEIAVRIAEKGGLNPGVAREVSRETGVPEADVFGVGSFFHLLADANTKIRVCTGLSCLLRGSRELLDHAKASGLPATGCSCLAACDRAPAVLRDREVLVEVSSDDVERAAGSWTALRSARVPDADWLGNVSSEGVSDTPLAIDLGGSPSWEGRAFARALELGPDRVVDALEASGLQGRGGAGFPAAVKWRGIRDQSVQERYVVLNADEGEPGTFKDRDVMLRRPDLVIEGLAIAARTLGANEVYLYIRGEFSAPWRSMERAIATFGERGLFEGVRFHLHAGHGAYICGEETALLEALEGKRGMPRLKPPFPVECGLWQKPTLIQNVETIACVPSIIRQGGEWFKGLGRTGPGTKLYCVSGHVNRPGTYELPLGVSLDELVESAGGYDGNLLAFSPGGASSGFLPASERGRPLDFRSLAEAGSMLGSAGVVVLNDTVDLARAVRDQLSFFEAESCGQCAPCRIGTRFLRESVDRWISTHENGGRDALAQASDVSWEMNEGSICGLGQAASLPLTTVLRYFPEVFSNE